MFCYEIKDTNEDTKMCLQMEDCAVTGFGIAVKENDKYTFYYLDGDFAPNATGSQASAIDLINNSAKEKGIAVTVTGTVGS